MLIQPVKAQFELQKNWYIQSLEGLTNENVRSPFREDLNTVLWIAGHILNTRMVLLSVLTGRNEYLAFNRLFGKGSDNKIDDSYPSLEVLKENWLHISVTLHEVLDAIPEEDLISVAPFQTSIPDSTLLGLIAYMAAHESYHIGQISVLRKLT